MTRLEFWHTFKDQRSTWSLQSFQAAVLISLLYKPRRMITRNQNKNQCLWTFLAFWASSQDRLVMGTSTSLAQGQETTSGFWGFHELQNSFFPLFLITAGEWFTYAWEELNLIELMVYSYIAKGNLELLILWLFWMLGLQPCTTMPGLCGAKDGSRLAVYQLVYLPRL